MTDSVKSAAEAEATAHFGTPLSEGDGRIYLQKRALRTGFVSGARWQREQDESEAMRVAAQKAERIRELEEGREMEQDMLRNAAARILELEQALEDSAARFRLLDANRSDAAAAMATRAEVAEARLDKIRAELLEPVRLGSNVMREWDTRIVRILAILDGETDDH